VNVKNVLNGSENSPILSDEISTLA